jgi:hypothetical protein
MRTSRFNLLLIVMMLSGAGLAAAGCEANVHDNTADVHDNPINADIDANFDFNIDSNADDVKAGDSVMVTMDAKGVVLVDPDQQPSSDDDKARAAYFKIFLDDADSDPLVVTASASVSVKIPADTKEGDHKLICRLFKHDGGSAIGDTKEISIKVNASASVTAGTAGSSGTDTMK